MPLTQWARTLGAMKATGPDLREPKATVRAETINISFCAANEST
jgi:hypothetical protein